MDQKHKPWMALFVHGGMNMKGFYLLLFK